MRAHSPGFSADRALVRASHLAMRAITHVFFWAAKKCDDQLHTPPDSWVAPNQFPVDDCVNLPWTRRMRDTKYPNGQDSILVTAPAYFHGSHPIERRDPSHRRQQPATRLSNAVKDTQSADPDLAKCGVSSLRKRLEKGHQESAKRRAWEVS